MTVCKFFSNKSPRAGSRRRAGGRQSASRGWWSVSCVADHTAQHATARSSSTRTGVNRRSIKQKENFWQILWIVVVKRGEGMGLRNNMFVCLLFVSKIIGFLFFSFRLLNERAQVNSQFVKFICCKRFKKGLYFGN